MTRPRSNTVPATIVVAAPAQQPPRAQRRAALAAAPPAAPVVQPQPVIIATQPQQQQQNRNNNQQTRNNNNNNNRRDNQQGDVIQSATTALTSALKDPSTLALILFAFVVAVDYTSNPKDNIIIRLATHLGETTPVGSFLKTNAAKVVGMLMLLPGALSAPKKNRYLVTLAVMFAVYVLPSLTYISYALIAVSLRVFFKTTNSELRSIIIIAAAVLAVSTAPTVRSAGAPVVSAATASKP
nr:hypothetical protein 2 [Red mite virga-like virus 2]